MTTTAGRPDRGLDWLNLVLSAANGAYGAFIPVYLADKAWTQTEIGLVLTVGTVTAVICLVPAGLLIDAMPHRRRRILGTAIAFGAVAPLLLAAFPMQLPVMAAVVLQAVAASLFTPAIAAISLGIAGRAGLSARLGRNARYGSIGAGLGAVVLGVCSARAGGHGVFAIATALTLVGLLTLRRIGPEAPIARDTPAPPAEAPAPRDADGTTDRGAREFPTRKARKPADPVAGPAPGWRASLRLLRDSRVLTFGLAIALFQIASIGVIQLAAVEATRQMGTRAGLIIAAFVIIPQLVVAGIAPSISRMAEKFGRKRVLLIGWALAPLRDTAFFAIRHPGWLVPVQALEGASGAVFGVMLPLVAADLTRQGGVFTSCMGMLGLASSLGSAISTSLAGWTADRYGVPMTYLVLAGIGVLAWVTILFMKETGPETEANDTAGKPMPARG